MKKLLLIFTLICAFSITASAQDKKVKPQDAAKADATELADLVGLTATQTQDLYNLFEMKYQYKEVENLSDERKQIITQTMDAKIRATLNEKQMATLESKPQLLERLIK